MSSRTTVAPSPRHASPPPARAAARGVRILILLACFAALATQPGCIRRLKVWNSVQTPDAQLLDVRLADVSDAGVRLVARLRLTNPNDIPLPLTEVEHRFELRGVGVFRLADDPLVTLPARGEGVVEIAAAFDEPEAIQAARMGEPMRYRVSGRVTYRPPGEIRAILTDSRVPLPSTGFDGRGEVGSSASHTGRGAAGLAWSPANRMASP